MLLCSAACCAALFLKTILTADETADPPPAFCGPAVGADVATDGAAAGDEISVVIVVGSATAALTVGDMITVSVISVSVGATATSVVVIVATIGAGTNGGGGGAVLAVYNKLKLGSRTLGP